MPMDIISPICNRCGSTEAGLWQKDKFGQIICVNCKPNDKTINQKSEQQSIVQEDQLDAANGSTDITTSSTITSNIIPDNTEQTSVPIASSTTLTIPSTISSTPSNSTSTASTSIPIGVTLSSTETTSTTSTTTCTSTTTSTITTTTISSTTSSAAITTATTTTATATTSMSLRKSVRNKAKAKSSLLNKQGSNKGKSRRSIFKRNVYKSPASFATPVTTDSLFYKGQYFQKGDIVALQDIEGGTYYAQIRGLLQDEYCEKSAALTWLIPTNMSSKGTFDPSTYILGPEEDIPRKLECMEFIMHAPSDYYKTMQSPYPVITPTTESGFIWTRLGPVKMRKEYKDYFISG